MRCSNYVNRWYKRCFTNQLKKQLPFDSTKYKAPGERGKLFEQSTQTLPCAHCKQAKAVSCARQRCKTPRYPSGSIECEPSLHHSQRIPREHSANIYYKLEEEKEVRILLSTSTLTDKPMFMYGCNQANKAYGIDLTIPPRSRVLCNLQHANKRKKLWCVLRIGTNWNLPNSKAYNIMERRIFVFLHVTMLGNMHGQSHDLVTWSGMNSFTYETSITKHVQCLYLIAWIPWLHPPTRQMKFSTNISCHKHLKNVSRAKEILSVGTRTKAPSQV